MSTLTQRPPVSSTIDNTNPFGQTDLIALSFFNEGQNLPKNYATGRFTTAGGTFGAPPTWVVAPSGFVCQVDSTRGIYYDDPSHNVAPAATNVTVALGRVWPGDFLAVADHARTLFGIYCGNFGAFDDYCTLHAPHAGTFHNEAVFAFGGGFSDAGHTLQGLVPFPPGYSRLDCEEMWICTAGDAGMAIYYNGVKIASSSSPVSRKTDGSHLSINWGNCSVGETGDDQNLYFFGCWNRQFTDAEALSLTNCPYQMLSPAVTCSGAFVPSCDSTPPPPITPTTVACAKQKVISPVILTPPTPNPLLKPYLIIPPGQGQTVNELDGHSSIAALQVESIDPGRELEALAARPDIVGTICKLKLGFPGMALGDFVTVSTTQLLSIGRDADGKMQFESRELLGLQLGNIWINGGPQILVPLAEPTQAPLPPPVHAYSQNFWPTSDKNPRYLDGNPIDLLLVALQNELGVGQDPTLPPLLNITDQNGTVEIAYGPNPNWKLYVPGQDGTLINPNTYVDIPALLNLRDTMFSGDRFRFTITRPVPGKQWIDDQVMKPLGMFWIARPSGMISPKTMKPPAFSAGQISGTGGTFNAPATGYVDLWGLNLVGDTVTLTINGIVKIHSSTLTETMAGVSQDLTDKINADTLTGVTARFSIVSASPQTWRILLTAITPGSGGNSITLDCAVSAPDRQHFTLSGATLTGGGLNQLPSSTLVQLNEGNIVGIPHVERATIVNVVCVRGDVDDSQRESAARQYQSDETFIQGISLGRYKEIKKQDIEANGLRTEFGARTRGFILSDRIFRRHAFAPPIYHVKTFLANAVLEIADYVVFSHNQVLDYLSGSRGVSSVVCEILDRQPHYNDAYVELKLADTRLMNITTPFLISQDGSVPAYNSASTDQKLKYFFISASDGTNSDGSQGATIF
jgi:hypothetical protein